MHLTEKLGLNQMLLTGKQHNLEVFLLYVVSFVLINTVDKSVYENFSLLYFAMSIFSSNMNLNNQN